MNAMRIAIGGLLFTAALGLMGPAPARAADAVLYEVTEAVRLGKGGSFDVLMQDVNSVDAPEIVIMRGSLSGTLDLSPAFVDKKPRGLITGEFHGAGVAGSPMAGQQARGRFDGTFRIPFRNNGKPSYLLDDESVVLVTPAEFILGSAMVRLELTFRDESLGGAKKGGESKGESKKDDKK